MVKRSIITPCLAVAFLCCIGGGTAQYDSCNGTIADIGDGRCDAALNTPYCGWDGGDCCRCTCVDGKVHSCSSNVFDCLYPDCGDPASTISNDRPCEEAWISDGECDDRNNVIACNYDGGDCCQCSCSDSPAFSCGLTGFDCQDPACFDPTLVGEFPDCTGGWNLIGDGSCDAENNISVCGWDGGDCCPCDCSGVACALREFDCLDPDAGDEFHDCKATPPVAPHCSPDVPRFWLVSNSAQAQDLAAAMNCSGGSFEVEWRGHVIAHEAIYVVDGTVLTVTGAPGAVVDGNGSTRLFTVVNATLHVNGVNISSGASVVGGAIAALGGTLTLNRTSLIGNLAALNAGAVYATDGSSISCVEVSFVDNTAKTEGGAMYVSGNSVVSCGGSWLNNTAGFYGGALSVVGGSTVSWGEEATFTGNSARYDGGALFVYNSSTISWSATTSFSGNTATTSGGAVYVYGSSVSWSASTTFVENRAVYGGALVGVANASVSWTGEAKSEFEGNAAGHGGAVTLTVSSHLSCTEETDASFTSNVAVVRGGALWLDYDSSAVFGGKASFDGNSATGDPDEFESGFGGAVAVETGSSVVWHRGLDFSGNSAEKIAGALYVSNSRVSWVGSTQIVGNNAALSGGALFIWNGSYVEWSGATHFTSNEAGADGGAVGSPVFDSEYNFLSSTLVVNGSTAFENNTSGANGGALALSEGLTVSILAANVSFMGNAAGVAGGAVHVSGSGIGPVFTGISFMFNSAQVGGAVSTVGSGNLKGFADVESPNPTTYDGCRLIRNTATGTGGAIESASGQDDIVNSVFEGNQAGAGGAVRLAGTASIDNCYFVENISDDGEGAAVSNIGSVSTMTNLSFSGNAFYCQPGMFLGFLPGDPFEAVCSGCQTSCDECFFEERDLVPVCEDVMAHSNSSGGTVTLEALSIEPGYWRATPSSTDIAACYHADACLGGVSGTAEYCLEGYEGPYCSICSDGYTAQLGFKCDKCSDSTSGIVVVGVLAVVAVFVGVAVVVYVMSGEVGCIGRGGSLGRLLRSIPLQSVKIVIVAWQILTQLFAAVANVTYPDVYQRFLDALDVVNFDLTWILSAGCVVDVDFHDRLLVSTITPLIALLFMAGTYAAATTINRGAPEALHIIWNKHVAMVLLLTFLVYSSVSAALFKTFACDPLDDGNIYLRADYRIECDSPKHQAFQVYAGVMIVLYTVGIPAFYGYLLFRDRGVLTKNEADREKVPHVTTTSDLWKPYKPSVFYYEVIECGRRILLAGVVVFIEPNTSAQIAVTLMMAFVFVVISEGLAPYASRWDAWLSRMGHAVVFVSMYVALLLKVDVSDERAGSQRVFEAILVAAHACMVSVVVVETVVLTCSLRADQQGGGPRTLGVHGDGVPGRTAEIPSEEANPFAGHLRRARASPVG